MPMENGLYNTILLAVIIMTAVELFAASFQYLIDVTLAYPPSVKYTPGFPDLLLGRPIEAHVIWRSAPLV